MEFSMLQLICVFIQQARSEYLISEYLSKAKAPIWHFQRYVLSILSEDYLYRYLTVISQFR